MNLFPQNNAKTHKEGVSRTYAGYDGYGAFGIYLGQEGWNLAAELRPSKNHSQSGFLELFREALAKTRRLTKLPLLGRLDSAHDALENRVEFANQDFDHIVKWNPRRVNRSISIENPTAYAKVSTPTEGAVKAWFSPHSTIRG
jgi:hypothetical protein